MWHGCSEPGGGAGFCCALQVRTVARAHPLTPSRQFVLEEDQEVGWQLVSAATWAVWRAAVHLGLGMQCS